MHNLAKINFDVAIRHDACLQLSYTVTCHEGLILPAALEHVYSKGFGLPTLEVTWAIRVSLSGIG